MNQKDRILELVDKGIISAEEAVVLLEKILSSKRPNRRIDSSGLKTYKRNRSPYR